MKKTWIEIAVNIIFWLISSAFIIYNFTITKHFVTITENSVDSIIERSDQLIYFYSIGQVFFAGYFYLQCYLILQLSDSSKVRGFLIQSLLLIGSFMGLYKIIILYFFENYIPMIQFPSAWYGIFGFYTIVAIGYGFVKVWIKTEQDRKELELLNKKAELNSLRMQLQPHFLFNTLNNLLAMVDQQQNPQLAKSIDKLSQLLRYVVYEKENSKVHIQEEIDFIRNFSALHLLRFEDGEVDFKLEVTGLEQQFIDKGILLCFIENAFKHGVEPEGNSFIHINIVLTDPKSILFQIENSIPETPDVQAGGYGLQAVKDRLQLAYPHRHILEINQESTYVVTLKLDIHESDYSR